MSVSNINALAVAVVEECRVSVSHDEAVEFLRPIVREFEVSDADLISQAAKAIEKQYEQNVVENGGVVIEYDGSVAAIDINEN